MEDMRVHMVVAIQPEAVEVLDHWVQMAAATVVRVVRVLHTLKLEDLTVVVEAVEHTVGLEEPVD
jgi:hypothetical protein